MKILTINRNKTSNAKSQRGFTLIELMVVIVIIGILAAVAIPAYNSSIQKSRRTDAKNGLLDLATREEKFYSQTNTYSGTISDLYPGATTTTQDVQTGNVAYYTLSATIPTSGTATTFTAQAQPIPGRGQDNDPCGTFTINSYGVTGNTGSTTTNCW